MLKVVLRQADVNRILNGLDRTVRDLATARSRALNRTIQMTKTEASRVIRQELPALKKRQVDRYLSVNRASRRNHEARLICRFKPMPLTYFDPQPKRPLHEYKRRKRIKGVSVRVKHGRKTIPGSFMARMKSGHLGVFRRKGKPRLPIKALYGPAPYHIFKDHLDHLQDFALEKLEQRLRHEVGRVLDRHLRAA